MSRSLVKEGRGGRLQAALPGVENELSMSGVSFG